jgi:hypothetical protein
MHEKDLALFAMIYDVIIHPGPFSSYDTEEIYHAHRYNAYQGVLAMYMYHTDMRVWVAIDLLFCDDIQTIFITDYFGWNEPSFSPEETAPFIRRWKIKNKESYDMVDMFSHYYMIDILRQLYPSYRCYFYNKGHYRQVKEKRMECIYKQIHDFHHDLPLDIIENIASRLKPEWMNYVHQATAYQWMKMRYSKWDGMFKWNELREEMKQAHKKRESFRGKIECESNMSLIKRHGKKNKLNV